MITPTDSLDDLKAQLNTYFEHLGENQYTRHLFGQTFVYFEPNVGLI